MRIALACDHGGLFLKDIVKKALSEAGCEVIDCGTDTAASVDYADFALKALKAFKQDRCDRIVLLCGTGIGMSMCANRVRGVRGTLCHDAFTVRMARQHNDSNCLILGGRTTGPAVAEEIVKIWLATPFEGGRHQARLDKIDRLTTELMESHFIERNQ
jgi:RpiB/LacA/LacB family sugar-phosphate isomerase